MNLTIDVGNSSIKYGIFNNSDLIKVESIGHDMLGLKLEELKNKEIQNVIISNVGKKDLFSNDELGFIPNKIFLDYKTPIPLEIKYSSPETLGSDRIALAVGAITKNNIKNFLVIDCGSCITYDVIANSNEFLGGTISPGLKMRYSAMNHFTENLPLLEPLNKYKDIGNSTSECIHSGVVGGIVDEINKKAEGFLKKNADSTILITGGDSKFLLEHLKSVIFVRNLLLEGLNEIILYNYR